MKKAFCFLVTALILLGSLFLGGCLNKTGNSEMTGQKDRLYIIAITGGTSPFNYLNKDGSIEGFETDLMTAIAREEGIRTRSEVTARAARIPALKSNQVDIIMAVMTITEERLKEVNFSDPYFEATIFMLVPLDSQIRSVDDLKGKTVACALATTSDIAVSHLLGRNYEGIKRFKDTTPAIMELRNGKVDAAVADCGIVREYIKNNPDAKLKIVRDDRFPKQYYGMAVRKDDKETLAMINRGLNKIKETGEYDKIYRKWFEN